LAGFEFALTSINEGKNMLFRSQISLLALLLLSQQCLSAARVSCLSAVQEDSHRREEVINDNIDDIRLLPKNDLFISTQALILSIENYYGPKKLKEGTLDLNWKKLNEKILNWKVKKSELYERLKTIHTEKEALFVITDFLLTLNDAHVSVQLPSTLTATLPMQLSYVPATQTFHINYIDPLPLSAALRSGEIPPLQAKLVKINDLEITEFQNKFAFFNAGGNPLTNAALFARSLFNLSESSGFPISLQKSMTWKFEFESVDPQSNQTVRSLSEFEYVQTGESIIGLSTVVASVPKKNSEPIKIKDLKRTTEEGHRFRLGQAESYFRLPKDFKKIELPEVLKDHIKDGRLVAGTFQRDNKRVGFLRIASYDTAGFDHAKIQKVVDFYIHQLEMMSDYLIIDQMGNPGGSVTYSDMIIERFVGNLDPTKHMKFHLKPTGRFMRNYESMIKSVESDLNIKDPEKRADLAKSLRSDFETVQHAYRTGEPLSDPVSLTGYYEYLKLLRQSTASSQQGELFNSENDQMFSYGQQAHYTKPVFMLVDHLSFSGGDATPANLMDYGRAILIGTRTAGAGGTVESFSSRLMLTEFSYNLTTSLMYRPEGDQKYVENFGVTPDYVVLPTVNDYTNRFEDFLNSVFRIVDSELKKEK
jgi:hypothetical protein